MLSCSCNDRSETPDLDTGRLEHGLSNGRIESVNTKIRLRSRGDTVIQLTPMEFDLLLALARRPQQVFSREMLLEQVWGYHGAGSDTRLVNVHVQRLRAKIEIDHEHPEIVTTVGGVGYKAGDAAEPRGVNLCEWCLIGPSSEGGPSANSRLAGAVVIRGAPAAVLGDVVLLVGR